jgi:hypothetical protein
MGCNIYLVLKKYRLDEFGSKICQVGGKSGKVPKRDPGCLAQPSSTCASFPQHAQRTRTFNVSQRPSRRPGKPGSIADGQCSLRCRPGSTRAIIYTVRSRVL